MLPPGLFASPLLRSVAEVFSGRGMIFVFGYKDLWGLAIGFLWGLSPIVSIYFYLHLYTVFRFSKSAHHRDDEETPESPRVPSARRA